MRLLPPPPLSLHLIPFSLSRSLSLSFSLSLADAEEQLAKLQQLSVQGRWLEWTDVMNSDLSWRRLLHGLDDSELSFSLRVITNTLPTPDNLRRWGQLTTATSCPLCGRKATLRHILNGCNVALRQGCYKT